MTAPDGITVQCISCKAKKLLTFAEAHALTDLPACERCFMPMVTVAAKVTKPLKSIAIQRIIDEVKDERPGGGGYNRVYHRHNR